MEPSVGLSHGSPRGTLCEAHIARHVEPAVCVHVERGGGGRGNEGSLAETREL